MHSKTKLTALGLAGTLVAFAACGPSDPAEEFDEPEIISFDSDFDAITSGVDVFDDEVQGEVELSWETDEAEDVALYANDTALPVEDCQPTGDDCIAGGTLIDEPTEETEYRLEVVSVEDESCDIDDGEVQNSDVCAAESLDVDVLAPALVSLEYGEDRFPRGEEFTVDYDVEHARDFELGIVEDGELTEVCEVDGDGPCSREDADSGELTISDMESSFTLSGWADNGADDDLGDVAVGDIELELHPEGAPVVNAFDADPGHVEFGGTSTLSWETEDAVSVEVSSDFDGLLETDLSEECTDVDADGEGSCEVEFTSDDSEDVEITFSLVAISEDDEESSAAETTVVLGSAPHIASFSADPEQLPADGGDVDLGWEVENNPDRLQITDGDGDTILDTDDGTGTDDCHSSGDGCEDDDGITVEGIEENTQFTLVASSPLGSDDSTVNVTIEGAPVIEMMEVDGQDVMDDPAIADDETAGFEWDTDETNDTELHRADSDDGSCSGIDTWDEVSGFDGSASGSDDLEELDQYDQCFRLTAMGDADQSDTRSFLIARAPEADSFDSDPTEATRGDDIELSWTAPFADEVSVDVSPGAAVSSDDLDECTDVDGDYEGSCTVSIRSGAPLGDAEFELEAIGFDDTVSDSITTVVHVGEGPTISSFTSPSTADEGDDVLLEWESSEGDELTIEDDDGEIFSSSDSSEIADGDFLVEDIQETTTWTLEVSNDFGSDTSDTTTFLGPAVDVFEVNGEDALDGEVDVFTGDVDLDWETSASEETMLQKAVDGQDDPTGDCDDPAGWEVLVDEADSNDSFTDDEVTSNRCYRLTAEDAAGQTSSVDVAVTEYPYFTDMETTPDEVDGDDPATVDIDMEMVGATEFEVRAYYFEEVDGDDDDELGDDFVCDEDDASGDTLDGSSDTKSVSCDHEMVGECSELAGCFGPDEPREDTDYIRYEIEFFDDEGDGDVDDSGEYDEDVDVDWD